MSSQGHMGLLRKANLLSQKKGLAFVDFIQKYNINRCAVFTKINNEYFITQSIGFDCNSICLSKSSVDFWDGLIPEANKVYNFNTSEKTLSSVLQFFSVKLKDEIEFVDIYKTSSNKILFLCNEVLSDDIQKSFSDVDEKLENKKDFNNQLEATDSNLVFIKYTIDFEEAVEAFINENVKENQEIISKSISNEIQNLLSNSFNAPHFFKKIDSYKSKVILTAKNEIPEQLAISHIISLIKQVLENNAALTNVYTEGMCQSSSQLIDFLQD